MLQTYEAVMQPNWGLEFSGPTPPRFDRAQKVLVTVLPADPGRAATGLQHSESANSNIAIEKARALRRVFPQHDSAAIDQEFQAQRI